MGATFHTHQTSGKCTGMHMCNHTHQMEKTEKLNLEGSYDMFLEQNSKGKG